ncbi:MAG: NifU N-terminal domain-containing protein, partial [Phycisphaerales bacterium]|nr:NifU N-terminal domain-containing protein [Phycisphaerales bacterium]
TGRNQTMPHRVTRFEPTPNPNAIKCVVEPSPGETPRSYFTADQARQAGDSLAVSLFEIPRVTNVLIHSAFITVSKHPDAAWSTIKPRIERALDGAA